MKDKIELARDLEDIRDDARIGKKIDYLETIEMLLDLLREAEDLKYCDGCHKHFEREDMRDDYCEACTVSAAAQRASDEMDYQYAKRGY